MLFPRKPFIFTTHSYQHHYWNKIKDISKCVLLLLLTNTHTQCTGGAPVTNPSPAISMKLLGEPTIIGDKTTIPVQFTVPDPKLLEQTTLCINIKDNGNNKSTITYKRMHGRSKKQTFLNGQKIPLNQLIQLREGIVQYEYKFKFIPGEQGSQAEISFQLSTPQDAQAPIKVTWYISPVQCQVVQATDNANKYWIEVRGLSRIGNKELAQLAQWHLCIISPQGTTPVTFDVLGFESETSAPLKDLLQHLDIRQLEPEKPCHIPIQVPLLHDPTGGTAFVIMLVKVKGSQKAGNKTKLLSRPKFIVPHISHTSHPSPYTQGVIDGCVDNTALKQKQDEAYQKGLRVGKSLAAELIGGSMLGGIVTLAVGTLVIVALPWPAGLAAAAILFPVGAMLILNALLPPPTQARETP
jgi:hypothetical protein